MRSFLKLCLLTGIFVFAPAAYAEDKSHHHEDRGSFSPVSVMGDHVHHVGAWMIAYRMMHMRMEGNRQGTGSIQPAQIVTRISNPNAPPPTLRVVPTKMDMSMHMISAMAGVTDKLSLMAMGSYLVKEMDHLTFAGASGVNVLGTFTTRVNGIGDFRFGGVYKIVERAGHKVNLKLGLSVPLGSIEESDDVLAPTGARPRLRLPYAMQLGSGTFDALPGIVYVGQSGRWGWGGEVSGVVRLEDENSEHYRLGHQWQLKGWGTARLDEQWRVHALATVEKVGKIKGADPLITAPVQTADPDNYGGTWVEAGGGFSYTPSKFRNLSFGAEFRAPVYEDVNGVQLGRDFTVTAGLVQKF